MITLISGIAIDFIQVCWGLFTTFATGGGFDVSVLTDFFANML